MITRFKLFEELHINSAIANAIENTKGAELLSNGNLKLEISRFQKPEQAGIESIRTGVFYLPEHDSPYSKWFKNKPNYGGKQKIESEVILEKPYIIKAGVGGLGPEKAYIELVGKEKFKEFHDDLYNIINFSHYNPQLVEGSIEKFLEKYGGNPDYAYNILYNSKVGNQLNMALREHIYANVIRNAGYDSVLSYTIYKGNYKFDELFYLLDTHYPE